MTGLAISSGAHGPATGTAAAGRGALIGASRPMQHMLQLIDRVAATDSTVLITGESGTGKELVSRAIHATSPRASGPFIPVNCAAIPESLIEAELFGHEKGSFTGAVRTHQGVFERGRGGTLFLDEIAEMAPPVQSRLLRVLQTSSFFRVGGTSEVSSDVRVIAATNSDLVDAVRAREFRADLLYRLAVFPLHVPPLRSRGNDIRLLAEHFLAQLNEAAGTAKVFGPQALEFLANHHWPGNVRELRNSVERGFIMADTEIALESAMPAGLDSATNDDGPWIRVRIGTPLADVEREVIIATLDQLGGNKRRTAATLGCSVKTLYNKLHQYRMLDGHDVPELALGWPADTACQ
jgi:DNA-binding NtrC family response regulator